MPGIRDPRELNGSIYFLEPQGEKLKELKNIDLKIKIILKNSKPKNIINNKLFSNIEKKIHYFCLR